MYPQRTLQGDSKERPALNLSVYEIPDLVGLKQPDVLFVPRSEKLYYANSVYPQRLLPRKDCFRAFERYLVALSQGNVSNVEHPCLSTEISCCESDEVLRSDRATVMEVMRLSGHRGQGTFNLEKITRAASSLGFDVFDLGFGPMKKDRITLPFGRDPFAMVPICEFKHADMSSMIDSHLNRGNPDCELFQPSLTDNGICHTFNAEQAHDQLNNSSFTDIFSTVFHDDLQQRGKLFNGQPFSQDLGLTFYLDKQMLFRNFFREAPRYSNGNFLIGFAGSKQSFAIRSRLRPVHAGNQVTFLLTPVVLASTKSLRSLPLNQRNCLFPDEASNKTGHMSILRHYSQRGCISECKLHQAQRTCLCTPWDMPYSSNGLSDYTKICNSYGYFCFNSVMKNTSYEKLECGHCLPDCDVEEYQVAETVTPLQVNKLCQAQEVLVHIPVIKNGH